MFKPTSCFNTIGILSTQEQRKILRILKQLIKVKLHVSIPPLTCTI